MREWMTLFVSVETKCKALGMCSRKNRLTTCSPICTRCDHHSGTSVPSVVRSFETTENTEHAEEPIHCFTKTGHLRFNLVYFHRGPYGRNCLHNAAIKRQFSALQFSFDRGLCNFRR